MAVTSTGHQSFQETMPALRNKTQNVRVWATTGNTDVVLDKYISANSEVKITNTSAYTGPWWISYQVGTGFTVNSGNSETASTTTYTYIII